MNEDYIKLEDGFYYYLPSGYVGAVTPHQLWQMADELDRLNEPWQRDISEYRKVPAWKHLQL